YHPAMIDVADQLILKWQRLNAGEDIDVVHDMTALTLETIGICGFGYRFNSFYRDALHPFVRAMTGALEATMMVRGLPMEKAIFWRREQRLSSHIESMNSMLDRIIADRKASGGGDAPKKDLLD